jgi:hypothetical protein
MHPRCARKAVSSAAEADKGSEKSGSSPGISDKQLDGTFF